MADEVEWKRRSSSWLRVAWLGQGGACSRYKAVPMLAASSLILDIYFTSIHPSPPRQMEFGWFRVAGTIAEPSLYLYLFKNSFRVFISIVEFSGKTFSRDSVQETLFVIRHLGVQSVVLFDQASIPAQRCNPASQPSSCEDSVADCFNVIEHSRLCADFKVLNYSV